MITNKVHKRLGCELEFDGDKEKDIIRVIDTLASRKDLGHLVSHLLRLAFESPEVYGNGQEVRKLIDKMMEYGTSPTRFKYFEQMSKDIEAMKCKIDTIYDMACKTYMLAEMGKRLGLEEKSKSLLSASFILERQISSMCLALGVDNLNHTFASNKLEDTQKRADAALEYIINCYDGIVQELKQLNTTVVKVSTNESEIVNTEKINKMSTEYLNALEKDKVSKESNHTTSSDEDEYLELVEDPNKQASQSKENTSKSDDELEIKVPTGDVADKFKMWMTD